MMTHARTLIPGWGREIGLGFLYWLIFLTVLEPGNVARAAANGVTLHWAPETMRILGASMLGALATPVVMSLIRRYPVAGDALWGRVTVHSMAAIAIAFGLIVVSCVLAPAFGIGDTRPFLTALPDHIAVNWLPLAFSLVAFTGGAHAVRYFAQAQEFSRRVAQLDAPHAPSTPIFLASVRIKARGHVAVIDLASVDWIETQGNYLALRTGSATHLLRETLAAFEPKLDPARFKRIHRRTLVAIDRVREVTPLANGDASVRLTDGAELRLSRGYRAGLLAALGRA